MTDNEIIKVLECLTGEMILCKDCPYSANYTHFDCQRQVAKDALDLINRQKAEIERLKAFKACFDKLYGKGIDIANWHLKPFDSFYESALQEMAGAMND